MFGGLFIGSALRQSAEAGHAQAAGDRAARAAADVRRQNESLRFDVEKLFMITEALWTILKEQHGYTDETLAEMIQQIDLRDGKVDGKAGKAAERPSCPQCGRKIVRNQVRCLYCGADAPQQPFER